MVMKRNFMAEKCFREIEKRTQKEILLNSEKRRLYLEQQMMREYQDEISRSVRRDMRMFG